MINGVTYFALVDEAEKVVYSYLFCVVKSSILRRFAEE